MNTFEMDLNNYLHQNKELKQLVFTREMTKYNCGPDIRQCLSNSMLDAIEAIDLEYYQHLSTRDSLVFRPKE